eukprot:gene9198-12407_t
MGIDHGLGGKDNLKSKQRREKKANRTRKIALSAIKGKKREIIFNEEDRKNWLVGFGKRKQARRKFGLAMEIIKKKKSHKELLKDSRTALKQAHGNDVNLVIEKQIADIHGERGIVFDSNNDLQVDEVEENEKEKIEVYNDPSTLAMFGSSVSVVIDSHSIDRNMMEDKAMDLLGLSGSDIQSHMLRKKEAKTMSKLDKALRTAGQMMNKKKSTKPNPHRAPVDKATKKSMNTKTLLNKALKKDVHHHTSKRKK